MLKVILGNILDIKEGVIIHQVNCKRVMGGGVALSIRNKYPSHYRDYINSEQILGNLVVTKLNSLSIVGMFSQFNYGYSKSIIYTNYDAFEECLLKIKSMKDLNPSQNFYMPYNIGCDRGNGDWRFVSSLIERICPFVILIKI